MAPDALRTIEYRSGPSVLLLGDSAAALDRARRSAESAGCRIADAVRVEAGVERLGGQVHVDGVVLELDSDAPGLDVLLDALETGSRDRRHGSVVIAPEALIDLVAARTAHRDIFHLCRPTAIERVATVAFACLPRRAVLNDVSRDDTPAILQQLSDEAARIASALASLAEEEGGQPGGDVAPADPSGKDTQGVDARLIRSIIRARRLRDRYFKGGLFADPAWDMLLDLMAARLEDNRVAVSSLCIAAAVPPTTALRWIKTLTDQGLLVRCADPQDGRRVYIELSDEAARALAAYVRAAQRISPLGL
jgi:DNA-binding MarR family transcriptional regulator